MIWFIELVILLQTNIMRCLVKSSTSSLLTTRAVADGMKSGDDYWGP